MEFNSGQKKIINGKPNGHMLIKGAKGAGKTTAFINKIPVLLNNYCISKDDSVLIATYNEEHSNKVSFIYKNIDDEKYHQNSFFDEDKSDKLEIITIDSLMFYYFNQYNKYHRKKMDIASISDCENELKKAINIIAKKYENEKINILDLKVTKFIQEELMWIKGCNYINLEEYQNANRQGRVSKASGCILKILRKNSKQRQAIYEILVEYNNNLKNRNKIDLQDLALVALEEAHKNPSKNYTHIFIDNSQNLTKVQLEFLKALYNEKTYSSITFTVDSLQYNNPYAWLTRGQSFVSLGYDMKGKSVSLRKSYTEEATSKIEKTNKEENLIYVDDVQNINMDKELNKITESNYNFIKNSGLTQPKNVKKDDLTNSALILDSIEYIDLKRNISHRFIKDSGALDEIYLEYNGAQEKVEDLLSIPVFNEIAAGSPILINDSIEDNYYLPKEWIRNSKDVFMLKVKGDSMINKNIYDDDYVVISKQNTPNVRDIVAVDIEGEATLKTYRIMNGKIVLMPENENYEPIIIEDQEFSFLGVAIGLIKNSHN